SAKTGRLRWEQSLPTTPSESGQLRTVLDESFRLASVKLPGGEQALLVLVGVKGRLLLRAYGASDGELLWDKTLGAGQDDMMPELLAMNREGTAQAIVVDRVVSGATQKTPVRVYYRVQAFDARTGKAAWSWQAPPREGVTVESLRGELWWS